MRRLIILGLILGIATIVAAQNFTLVSGTVTDPNSLAYAYGTVTAHLITAGTTPTLGGNTFDASDKTAGLDKTGSFTMQLASSTAMSPNLQWKFTVSSAQGTIQPAGGTGMQTFSVNITITGATQSVSATLSAAAPALSNITGGGGSVGPGTIGFLPEFLTTTTIGDSPCDDSITTAATVTCSKKFSAPAIIGTGPGGGVGQYFNQAEGTAPATDAAGNTFGGTGFQGCYAASATHRGTCKFNGGTPSAWALLSDAVTALTGTIAADAIVQNATGGAAAATAVDPGTCTNDGSHASIYTKSDHAWHCASISGGGAGLSSLPVGNAQLATGVMTSGTHYYMGPGTFAAGGFSRAVCFPFGAAGTGTRITVINTDTPGSTSTISYTITVFSGASASAAALACSSNTGGVAKTSCTLTSALGGCQASSTYTVNATDYAYVDVLPATANAQTTFSTAVVSVIGAN